LESYFYDPFSALMVYCISSPIERSETMSIQIVLLGLLQEKSYHPYEMKKTIIENKWDHLFPVTDGNIYHAIRKLEKNDWVEAEKEEQVNNRPNRTVYRITDEGRVQLSKEIQLVFEQRLKEPRSLYPATLFIHSANVDEITKMIEQWINELRKENSVQTEYPTPIPQLIHRHYKETNELYIKWFEDLLATIKKS
jgi:DNA-binding PadR family transcriptional regulator